MFLTYSLYIYICIYTPIRFPICLYSLDTPDIYMYIYIYISPIFLLFEGVCSKLTSSWPTACVGSGVRATVFDTTSVSPVAPVDSRLERQKRRSCCDFAYKRACEVPKSGLLFNGTPK